MRPAIRHLVLLAGTALALSGGAANALTCYVLFDRNDNVVYRDTIPPVDLSDQGAPARAAMRQRGEYMMISDVDRCPQAAFVFGQAGSASLSIDDFLGTVKPESRASAATPGRARSTSGSPGSTAARPSTVGK
jgi:hypothetical protein